MSNEVSGLSLTRQSADNHESATSNRTSQTPENRTLNASFDDHLEEYKRKKEALKEVNEMAGVLLDNIKEVANKAKEEGISREVEKNQRGEVLGSANDDSHLFKEGAGHGVLESFNRLSHERGHLLGEKERVERRRSQTLVVQRRREEFQQITKETFEQRRREEFEQITRETFEQRRREEYDGERANFIHEKIIDLVKFSKNFKIVAPIQPDLLEIMTKDPAKQKAIIDFNDATLLKESKSLQGNRAGNC